MKVETKAEMEKEVEGDIKRTAQRPVSIRFHLRTLRAGEGTAEGVDKTAEAVMVEEIVRGRAGAVVVVAAEEMNEMHERILDYLVTMVEGEVWSEVKVRRNGYDPPEEVTPADGGKGEVPDVSTIFRGDLYFFVVETCESIEEEDTRRRWRVLHDKIQEAGGRMDVVIPKECGQKAWDLMDDISQPNAMSLPNARVWSLVDEQLYG